MEPCRRDESPANQSTRRHPFNVAVTSCAPVKVPTGAIGLRLDDLDSALAIAVLTYRRNSLQLKHQQPANAGRHVEGDDTEGR